MMLKTLAILKGHIKYSAKFVTYIAKFDMLLASFHRCKWPNVKQVISSSGHTERGRPNSLTIIFSFNFNYVCSFEALLELAGKLVDQSDCLKFV